MVKTFEKENNVRKLFVGHLMEDSGEGLVGGFVVLKPDEKMEFEVDNKEKLKIGRQYLTLIQA